VVPAPSAPKPVRAPGDAGRSTAYSVLREFGLPREALGWSLFGFNVGVELGQLIVVVPCAVALAWLRRASPLAAARMAMIGSVVVVVAGAWWFIARVFFPEGLA
jgi:hypothetical protein